MIFDLDSGAPEFDGARYEPSEDPYFYRQLDPTTYWGFSEEAKSKPPYTKGNGPKGVMLFAELKDAFLGVVDHVQTPPRACYSVAGTIAVLKTKHGLNASEAKLALEQLKTCDLGPNTPCFLDSSSLEG